MNLSIVIPTRNRPEDLAKMLQSLASADKAEMDFEVLVVDNNSHEALAKQNRDIVNRAELPVRYLQESVRGQSAALNKGIALARGEIIAFLDDDIVIHGDYFDGLKRSLALPGDVFGGRVLASWPYKPPAWITEDENLTISRGPIIAHNYGNDPKAYDDSMNLPIGCNFFCRRSLFSQHGKFNVRLGPGAKPGILGGGEIDLIKRFRQGGARLIYAPWVTVDHPVVPERMKKSYFRYRFFCAGRSVPHMTKRCFPSVFGVPRYLYRKLGNSALNSLLAALSFRSVKAFDHQLQCCEILGSIYEYTYLQIHSASVTKRGARLTGDQ
jgi:glycosyltransferase involved in cell wall biosynthesis